MTNTIKELCDSYGVVYHHHDEFDEPRYVDDPDLNKAVNVIYSSAYSPWTMAINLDGTVVFPGHALRQESIILLGNIKDLLETMKKDALKRRRRKKKAQLCVDDDNKMLKELNKGLRQLKHVRSTDKSA